MFERNLQIFDTQQMFDKEKFDLLRKKIIGSNNTGAWMEVKFIASMENVKIFQELAILKSKKFLGFTKESQNSLKHIQDVPFNEEIIFTLRPNFGDLSLFPENKMYIDILIRILFAAKSVDIKK